MPHNLRWTKGSGIQLIPAQPNAAVPGVFILSDVRLYRDGLAWSLSDRDDINVVGAAEPSEIARSQLIGAEVAVLLLDATTEHGLDIVKDLKVAAPQIRVVVFAVNEQERMLLAYAAAGVAGFVNQDAEIDDVVDAIRCCLCDEIACTPRLAGQLFHRIAELSGAARTADPLLSLTRRERDIAECVADGLSNKEIARVLRISAATVKNHVHNILEKLRVSRRGEAAAQLRHNRRPAAHWQKSPVAP